MQSKDKHVPGVILAGGQGRRIGGNKAHVLLAGRPLWTHAADRIGPQVSRIAMNTSERVDGMEVVRDAEPDLGPLGGILAAMRWAQRHGAARVLTVAVDTPFLPLDLVARLQGVDASAVVAKTADGLHATTGLWETHLADGLQQELEKGTRKVTEWSGGIGLSSVYFDDSVPPGFFNVNTREDLARAEAWI